MILPSGCWSKLCRDVAATSIRTRESERERGVQDAGVPVPAFDSASSGGASGVMDDLDAVCGVEWPGRGLGVGGCPFPGTRATPRAPRF